ncbi:ABC transporter permease [Anaerosoma tenue]|uniref:ABC transporter permease n=1 Tax=Anaerosoma tenue TaxID=2933588 RepID=UPI002260C208|nr:iron export ABC transporter permease subunit FetB [Anaerosoma tenue]MCK8115911.1 iron export ABC transporter permease subunit FetB [Anaerosoma tenue]
MPETVGVVAIGWPQLLLSAGFMVFVGVVSIRLSLGIEKSLAVATLRTYVQLFILGLVLRWVFGIDSPWLVLALLLVMVAAAARTIVQRAPDAPRGIFGSSFVSMLLTGFIVTFAVTGLVVQVEPWYRAQYVIPIAGMVLGNSMNGIALSLERMFADLDLRAEELLALVALGATPWEAAGPSVRKAISAALIPTINSMAAAGIVFIPGMMTGQILAGADPLAASAYQIVVMLMVAAATALGSVVAVMLTFRKRFSDDGVFLEQGMREENGDGAGM